MMLMWILLIGLPLSKSQNVVELQGQLSVYSNMNLNNDFPLWNGVRYIPQVTVDVLKEEATLLDVKASANIFGSLGIKNFNHIRNNGNIKPYRLWARYSTHQFELRGGLQKINFGSASILRPLMWFDQVDPRDPLQMTDGVWGVLGRYYFLNNANAWFWALCGNRDPKGWEMQKTVSGVPELGGRFQYPVSTGEAAIAYHYRMVDFREASGMELQARKIAEHRIGFDAKFDRVVGIWFETSWKRMNLNIGRFTNQELLNLGADYTFAIGNGFTFTYEQLLAAYDEQAFRFENPTTFSLISASYPVGFFDDLSFIFYYDWHNNATYNFLNWQKQLTKLTFHVMGYANPKAYNIPTQQEGGNLYSGTGFQIMVVFNH
jgi:hypothetical protein